MKKFRFGLLPRIIVAIVLGVALGGVMGGPWIRAFMTFNAIFSQFLGFLVPIIIVGLVTPAIAGIGKSAGKMLLATVAVAWMAMEVVKRQKGPKGGAAADAPACPKGGAGTQSAQQS